MDFSHAISTLESAVGDPHQGLPEEAFLFVSRVTPLVNVDLLIQDDDGRTLLTWRDDELCGSGWHVPGGIIRYKEMAADRIRACALGELGAEVTFESTPVLLYEAILDQRTRGHFISMLYRCRLLTLPDARREGRSNPPARGEWRWHHSCPHDFLTVQAPYARFI